MPADRTYSEAEIALLLKRSAELQAENAKSSSHIHAGLTLSELQTLAQETGLEASFLTQAALEMEMSQGAYSLGKSPKTHQQITRFVAGELTDEVWDEIVFSLRRQYESESAGMYGPYYGKGISERIGKNREWRFTSLSGLQTTVLCQPYKGGTRIELSQRVGFGSLKTEATLSGLFLAFFPALAMTAILGSVLWGSASFIAFFAVLAPLMFVLGSSIRNSKLKKLNAIGDAITERFALAAKAARPTIARSAETTPAPAERTSLLDADEVDSSFGDPSAVSDPMRTKKTRA